MPAQPAREATTRSEALPPYGHGTLAPGIRSRMITNVNGLTVHILEAGHETPDRPAVLLLHGFPELAYSWRKVMLPLAAAGYHVIAPDQRGYGRTTGWDGSYDADPDPFRLLNMVRDAMGLCFALGHRAAAAVVGHDAGSPVAAWCALSRPDVFRRVVMMSSPFAGAPSLPFNTANGAAPPPPPKTDDEFDAELAALDPPRKYYQNYQRGRGANDDMLHAPQGLAAFFRAYYHYKSADWTANKPHPLAARQGIDHRVLEVCPAPPGDEGTRIAAPPFRRQVRRCDLGEAGLHIDDRSILIEHANLDGGLEKISGGHAAEPFLSLTPTAAGAPTRRPARRTERRA
jgi:pimeloyl-ACP methyl ester carboxylesterase